MRFVTPALALVEKARLQQLRPGQLIILRLSAVVDVFAIRTGRLMRMKRRQWWGQRKTPIGLDLRPDSQPHRRIPAAVSLVFWRKFSETSRASWTIFGQHCLLQPHRSDLLKLC